MSIENIFEPNLVFRITHNYYASESESKETYISTLPVLKCQSLFITEEEQDIVVRHAIRQMKWFETNGILNEDNKNLLLTCCLTTPPPQFDLMNKFLSFPEDKKEKLVEIKRNAPLLFEIMASWAILTGIIDDHLDDVVNENNKLDKKDDMSRDGLKSFGTSVVTFLASILYGEYKDPEDLPEFILDQYPNLYIPLKGILLRVNELKFLDPNYKETLKYTLIDIIQMSQSALLNLVETQRPNFPVSLYQELNLTPSGGGLCIEGGILFYEHAFSEKIEPHIRNHILFSHLKTLVCILWLKFNLIVGLGVDLDRNDISQSLILFKQQLNSNKENGKNLNDLIAEELKDLKNTLVEIDMVCNLFIEEFPGNPQVEFIAVWTKFSYGVTIRTCYLGNRYDNNLNRKAGSNTQIELVNLESGKVYDRPTMVELYNKAVSK